jgi:NDP-sugar pyrophosphorylase family protein
MTSTSTLENILGIDNKMNENLNIVISIAGPSDVIDVKGVPTLKHLIKINDEPFLSVFLKNLNISGDYIFLIQKEYNDLFDLKKQIEDIVPKCKIIELDGFKNGSALTLFELRDNISIDKPVLFVNSDFTMDWDSNLFMNFIQNSKCDSCLVTYKSDSLKHSYCTVKDGIVMRVVEKKVISDVAIVGIYYWSNGNILINSIESMIKKEINHNGIYYISLSFNELVGENYKITTYPIDSIKILDFESDIPLFNR